METLTWARNQRESPLLRLPAELRLQIYDYVIGSRIVHISFRWIPRFDPTGFKYDYLQDLEPLLEQSERAVHKQAIQIGSDISSLARTCQLVRKETACLPFQAYTWAFGNAFVLDSWLRTEGKIPLQQKRAVKTIALPAPGPYRSSERVLLSLREVFLTGHFSALGTFASEPKHWASRQALMLTLKKPKTAATWEWNGAHATYLKDLF
ncbi:hypothetical protein CC86DRAFT_110463 [Ophiobolus disseminans]|uniref:DUF7730 domain-containing protein n=1 Tax=Ophiobolus disseminans TaxID=1469910 RepID=A0A6A6ZLV1_9PLEO|nr:hypothetical protein CC86DRAFT_110463 [Ophiobolus disseminans]